MIRPPLVHASVQPQILPGTDRTKAKPSGHDAMRAVKRLQRSQATLPTTVYNRTFSPPKGWSHPEVLRPQAFHTLGYSSSAQRSAAIAHGLQALAIFDDQGILCNRRVNVDAVCAMLNDVMPSDAPKLSVLEQHGVRTYLAGVVEEVDQLGESIERLPYTARTLWLYYADFIASPNNSEEVMHTMHTAGVLDRNALPINGGKAFDGWRSKMLHHPAAQTPVWPLVCERIRNRLFALPSYTPAAADNAPPYHTHVLPPAYA